jgi:hypothetical protein
MVDAHQGFLDLGNPASLYDDDDLHMSSEGYGHWNNWTHIAMGDSANCVVWLSGQCVESAMTVNATG